MLSDADIATNIKLEYWGAINYYARHLNNDQFRYIDIYGRLLGKTIKEIRYDIQEAREE